MQIALYSGIAPAEYGLVAHISIRLWILETNLPTDKYLIYTRTTFPNDSNIKTLKKVDLDKIKSRLLLAFNGRGWSLNKFDLQGSMSIDLHFSQIFVDTL